MTDTDPAGLNTPVARAYARLVQLSQPQYDLSEDDRAARGDRLAQAIEALVRLPAETVMDVERKLAVLCSRLRASGGMASVEVVTDYMLAESARDDLRQLVLRAAAPVGPNAAPPPVPEG